MANIANYWAAKDMKVTLLLLLEEPPFYGLDQRVNVGKLALHGPSENLSVALAANIRWS